MQYRLKTDNSRITFLQIEKVTTLRQSRQMKILLKRFALIICALIIFILCSYTFYYPIDHRRIESYCKSINSGDDINPKLRIAQEMFGIKIWEHQSSTVVIVKSAYIYKLLCVINIKDDKITNTSFIDD